MMCLNMFTIFVIIAVRYISHYYSDMAVGFVCLFNGLLNIYIISSLISINVFFLVLRFLCLNIIYWLFTLLAIFVVLVNLFFC